MELLDKLGIDFRILIAQIVNFFVLLFVLYKFAYKPILRALENRTKRIEQSLKDAKNIEVRLQEGETAFQAKITEAEKKAGEIMVLARTEADELRNKMLNEAKVEIQALVVKTQAQVKDLKEQVIIEARSELADLVVDATSRVLSEKMTDAKDISLVKRALSEVKQ